MSSWLETDWARLFRPQMSLPEILVRGTVVYLSVVVLLRVILKRQAGRVGLSDLLVVALVGGICRNPLVRDAYSITDALLTISVILVWSYALDWLSYYLPWFHQLSHPKPVELIRNGVVLKNNLRNELVTDSQLCAQLRQHGFTEPGQVSQAWMEGSGEVSVIPRPSRRRRRGEAHRRRD